MAVWDEVLAAPPPVVSIWSAFPDPAGHSVPNDGAPEGGKKKQKAQDVKVDVVADAGLSWIRVNTLVSTKVFTKFVIMIDGKQD